MPETDIGSASIGNIDGTITDFSVDSQTTDGPTGHGETEYTNEEWDQQFGYYKKIPELKAAIDAKARWTVGKGFMSNPITEITLSSITGNGKDTFNTILENCVRVYQIGGDSFCEVIRDKKGKLVNLKPLDPSTITIVANAKGRILRYEQRGKDNNRAIKKFKPDEMFHLARNRVADEIHGVSLIPAVEEIILMRNEAMDDYKKLLHRNVYPVRIFYLDTDDPTEISAFITKQDKAFTQGENIYVPKGSVETELSSVPSNATLNPLPWIQQLNRNFYQATEVPQIIVGGSEEFSEASSKIAYLAFEQVIEEEQLFLEEQTLLQLGVEIELEFPNSLQNELLSDSSKSETMQASTPEDTAITNVGVSPTGVQ